MSNYVPSVTFNTCDDMDVVRSAGEAFGDFQLMLADFDASRLYYTIPDFHDTRQALRQADAPTRRSDPCGRVAAVRGGAGLAALRGGARPAR